MTIINSTAFGRVAFDLVFTQKEATLLNHTSKGIFFRMPNRWHLFLSYENFKGPLTINIPISYSALLQSIEFSKIIAHRNKLEFVDNNLKIALPESRQWSPPGPKEPLEKLERYAIVKELSSILDSYETAYPNITKIFIDLAENKHPPTPETPLTKNLLNYTPILKHERNSKVTNALSSFLGLGEGLTPQGDDFLTGFFLTLNRFPQLTSRPEIYKDISRKIVNEAYKKTTLLSSNLLECALSGQADERILLASDSLLTGTPSVKDIAHKTLTYGSTSGMSALAGILAASLFL
jgi:hypothetical protein